MSGKNRIKTKLLNKKGYKFARTARQRKGGGYMKLSKEIRTVAVCGVFILLVTCLAGVILGTEKPESMQGLEEVKTMAEQISATSGENKYIVRENSGYITVYMSDDIATPYMTTDILVATLRVADAEKLREGIEVRDDSELSRLLEDFGS